MNEAYSVLIPLVQGRFLFAGKNKKEGDISLNPFGSGTFFIQWFSYW